MITVGDVMNMRAFDSIWLATPCDGAAAREVTGVGTLDHEPFTGGYEVFTQGEFVFTTLGFAGVHPDLAEEALLALIECGVAAVAVKARGAEGTAALGGAGLGRAGRARVLLRGRYMERVIADLMNLLDDDAAEWGAPPDRPHSGALRQARRALHLLHHRRRYGRHHSVFGHTPRHRRRGIAARIAEGGGRGTRRLW